MASYTLNGYTRTLDYDAASRVTAIQDAVVQNFSYDNLDRLINYTRNSITVTSESYSYDAVGNRTQLSHGSSVDNYAYAGNSHRLTAITGTHPKSYSYTANGNIASDGASTYSYDARNRLVNAGSTLYALNGLGQRLQKAGPFGTTNFVYDEQGQLLGEYAANGNPIQETVYLGAQPVAVLKQNAIYYVHTDHLDTPRALSDTNNTVVWRWDADAFGTTSADEDPDMNGIPFTYNLRFPGQYFDRETGLHYNYFRDYDPSTGRYISSDPIGLEGGLNTYAYVSNNPLRYIDPTGLDATVTLYPGAVRFGHVGIGVNSPNTTGFYPSPDASTWDVITGQPVPGVMQPDTRTPTQTITIPAQDKAIQDYINSRIVNPGNYDLNDRNCTTTVRDALGAAGINTPATIYPKELMRDLQRQFGGRQ